jgi:hypothetical protein
MTESVSDKWTAMYIDQAQKAIAQSIEDQIIYGSGAVSVTWNGAKYLVPSFSSVDSWWVSNKKEKPVKQMKISKDNEIKYLRLQVESLRQTNSEQTTRLHTQWCEIQELKGPSKNPGIKALKAFIVLPLMPIIALGTLGLHAIESLSDFYDSVFR